MPNLNRRESELLRDVKAVLETLKGQVMRVKTEGVKENVKRLTLMLKNFMRVRDEVSAEWRAKLDCAQHSAAEREFKLTSRLEATEGQIVGALELVATWLLGHDKSIAELSEGEALTGRPPPSAE